MYHTALERFVSDVSGAVRFCIVFEKTLIGAGGGFITVPVDANLFGISLGENLNAAGHESDLRYTGDIFLFIFR